MSKISNKVIVNCLRNLVSHYESKSLQEASKPLDGLDDNLLDALHDSLQRV